MLDYSQVLVFFWYFSPKHFLIDDTATTKEEVITGFQLWPSQRFNRHNAYAKKLCFVGISASVFVRFAFARLGSAQVGSWRAKNQAEIIGIRRYGTAVY